MARCRSCDSRYRPTNSHTSVQSKLPMVISKSGDFFLSMDCHLCKGFFFFGVCNYVYLLLCYMQVYWEAKVKDLWSKLHSRLKSAT